MKGACSVDFAELAKEELIFPSVELEDNVSVIRFLASKLREKGVSRPTSPTPWWKEKRDFRRVYRWAK